MNDRESVIKGLECHFFIDMKPCEECPYYSDEDCCRDIAKDAITLLKAQEPIAPHMVDWGIYECPICKTRVDKTYKFCKVCGKGIKWE